MRYPMQPFLWLMVALIIQPASAQQRPADILAQPGRIILADGSVVPTQRESLAAALMIAQPGQVVGFDYALTYLTVASGDLGKRHTAIRPQPFADITVRGVGPGAQIDLLTLGDRGGGIAGLRFDHVRFNGRGRNTPVIGNTNAIGGALTFTDCTWMSNANTKWGIRLHGSFGPVRIVRCDFTEGGMEHAAYIDNVQGLVFGDNEIRGWLRSGIQLVQRTYPHTRPGTGNVYIFGNTILDTGYDGASAITLAGHGGTGDRVYVGLRPDGVIRPNRLDSPHRTGALVAYRDRKQYDLGHTATYPPNQRVVMGAGYMIDAVWDDATGTLTDKGWAIDHLIVYEMHAVLPGADRSVMAVGGVRRLDVIGGMRDRDLIQAPKTALDIAHAGQACGEVRLIHHTNPPSAWPWYVPTRVWANRVPVDEDDYWHTGRGGDN